MKTERRHELHTNALADWLGDQIERVRPYSRLALGVLLAVVVALGLYAYLSSRSARLGEQGWQRYFLAVEELYQKGNPEDLTQLAQSAEFSQTAVSYWATLALGDYHLGEGINQLFNDREAARTSLRAAANDYIQVSSQTQFPSLAERAVLGAARAYESLNELDTARSLYETLASKGTGPYALEGQERQRDLGQEPTKRFYDWFWSATPPRAGLGGPGMPGLRPDSSLLPDERSFTPPRADSDSLLSTPANKDKDAQAAEGTEETPADAAADDAPPGAAPDEDQPPSADAPASDKPAADAPPDATTPSAPQP
jgi:hypothetical protein